MVLDTASLYFRAFYGVPSSIVAPDGTQVNAVRGLLDFISRLITDHEPTNLIAAWDDDWRPDFRVDAVPSYKAHRVDDTASEELDGEDVPDELAHQVDLIIEVLDLFGIARLGAPGFEADDVIGSLVAQSDYPVLVVTGDRDLFQLVDDARPVRVLYTASKGVGNAEVIDNAAIVDRYGVSAAQYADYALLRGDTSDGLPGVRGIGEKTAAALVSQFGTVADAVAAVQAGNSGVKAGAARNLLAGVEYIERARPVVQVVRDIPLARVDSAVPSQAAYPVQLNEFALRWGLTGSVSRLQEALNLAAG
jgi:5'-3' exonuclease